MYVRIIEFPFRFKVADVLWVFFRSYGRRATLLFTELLVYMLYVTKTPITMFLI